MQQKPSYLSSREEFSTATPRNASPKPSPASKPPESGNSFPKVVIGGIALGAAVLAAHQAGYLDQILHKEKHDSQAKVVLDDEDRSAAREEAKPFSNMVEEKVLPIIEVHDEVNPETGNVEEKGEIHSATSTSEELTGRGVEIQPPAQDKSEETPGEYKVLEQEKSHASSIATGTSVGESLDREITNAGVSVQASKEIHDSNASSHDYSDTEDAVVESPAHQNDLEEDRKEVSMSLTNESDY